MTKKRGFFKSRLVLGTCRSPRGRARALSFPSTLPATFPCRFLATSHHHASPPGLLPLCHSPLTGGLVAGKGDGEVAERGGGGKLIYICRF